MISLIGDYLILSLYVCLGFPDSSVDKESDHNAGDPSSIPGLGRSTGERKDCPLQYSWASLEAQLVKNLPAMWETRVQSLGLGRSPGEKKGYWLQYSGLEYSMDCIVHRVAKNRTRLRDFHFTSCMPITGWAVITGIIHELDFWKCSLSWRWYPFLFLRGLNPLATSWEVSRS